MTCEEKCFTFTWKLENVTYCLQRKDKVIFSPDFVVDSIDETKWYLGVYLRGKKDDKDDISFYLYRCAKSKGDDKVSIIFELAFIAKDGSALTSLNPIKHEFPKNKGHGFTRFQRRELVFIAKRSAYLPQDTLTARCRIWKSDGEMTEDVQCFARTHIGVEKRSFLWNIQNFSTLESGRKYTYEMKSLNHDKQLMTVNLSLTEGLGSDEIICIELNLEDQAIKFSTLVLSLINISRNRIECNRDEFWFDGESKSKEFKFFFSRNKLMAMKSSYLPDDVLSLHWGWTFSKGVVLEEIEDVQYASISSEEKFFNAQNVNNQKITPLSYPLNDNLKSLYDKNFLCDIKLKTSTSEFKAHKVVLSASSSVFEAMFSSDMKEKESNCINIEDLSDDTIGRMLAFIYTARIEDLTYESSTLLYAAADKYAIFSLKNICSTYLMENISPINACDILLLSDFHADGDLKSAVQDYMLKHLKEIISSDGWKLLMGTNATLAAETLSLPYK